MHTIPPDNAASPPPLLQPLRDPLFDALRDELQGCDTPPAVRKQLMAAFSAHHAGQRPGQAALPWWRRPGRAAWAMAGCGLGCVGALCLMLVVLQRPPVAGNPAFAHETNTNAFIALDTLERIEQDPAPHMLATTVSRASLASLGVMVSPENAGDMVMAEMLVGADGSPLALRLAAN